MSTPRREPSIYLLRVGNSYAAMDPAQPAGEWRPMFFFDGSFRYLGAVAGRRSGIPSVLSGPRVTYS